MRQYFFIAILLCSLLLSSCMAPQTEAPSVETVAGVFCNLLSTITDDELDAVADIIEPLVAEHLDSLTLNKALFSKVEAVYLLKDELDLNEEEYRLLEEIYRDFAENGAALPDQDRERLVEINMALASLTLQFSQNVMADVEEYQLVVEDADELSGLPTGVISAAAEAATAAGYQQAWLFTLQGPSIMPLLTYADNRDAMDMFVAFRGREPIIEPLLKQRGLQ